MSVGLDPVDRWRGCLLGLACGDAVGTTVEFSPRGSFPPVTDMVGGGPFGLLPGQWTDDTSMALCLATSLVHCRGTDLDDQISRYVNWWQWGYLSSTGDCFDIGMTVRAALNRFLATKDPVAGDTDPRTAGNGSLMRLAPVAMWFAPDVDAVRANARLSSLTTHGAPEAVDCCEFYADMLVRALAGAPRDALLRAPAPAGASPRVREIAGGGYLGKTAGEVRGTGYCVDSLEAALWCFASTESFEDAVLAAANLGNDADTTAAIVGQLAGAHYGLPGIPAHWLDTLAMRDDIDALARALHTR
jgi:ADP-ribosyl-[dinitrogen reductase] hydrolase